MPIGWRGGRVLKTTTLHRGLMSQSCTEHRIHRRREMDNSTDRVSNRKIRKPLMERKRRARINRSLDELYQILTETDFASKGTKLEKADILEMTVQYIKQMREKEGGREVRQNVENVMLERYLLGFERCAEEIETVVDPRLKQTINRHLKNCLDRARNYFGGGEKEPDDGGASRRNGCSVLIREPKDFRILPSKLPNGDVLLLLSSSDVVKCEERLVKREMWRPWW